VKELCEESGPGFHAFHRFHSRTPARFHLHGIIESIVGIGVEGPADPATNVRREN
jgi:hypothetical protein